MNQTRKSNKRKFDTSNTVEPHTTICTADMDELKELLSEQRHELASAQTLESDFNFAFNLQIQEAITASLTLHPSSSSSSSSLLPELPPPSFVVNSDEGLSFASLVAEEIDQFEQEVEDRVISEAEVRKMRDDLDRRIHDQNFAKFIQRVPEDDWIKYGDNYERPYHGEERWFGEDTVNESEDNSLFRVYFKGLVSEESIGDVTAVVAAIGVGICDCNDNLLFELRKPFVIDDFDDDDGDQVARESSGVEAGIEALIEGLNAAAALDLKRIACFCDDHLIHQYVMEGVPCTLLKVSKLVSDVLLLRRKFTTFTMSVVALHDIKFAFKLARDAIVSQITWQSETDHGKNLMETCTICFENTVNNKMFTVAVCFHRFCFSCMKKHVEVKLLNGLMVKCPHENCEIMINMDTFGEFMDPKLVEVMRQRKKEALIPVMEKVYCPYPKCSALMSQNEVLEYTNSITVGSEQSGVRKCTNCQGFFCINCKIPWHNNMTCDGYKKLNPHLLAGDTKLISLAREKLWRQCVKCKHMIELSQGCYHIYCRCGYEFCYTCGAEWKNKKATCSCPLWAEPNLLYNDGERRE